MQPSSWARASSSPSGSNVPAGSTLLNPLHGSKLNSSIKIFKTDAFSSSGLYDKKKILIDFTIKYINEQMKHITKYLCSNKFFCTISKQGKVGADRLKYIRDGNKTRNNITVHFYCGTAFIFFKRWLASISHDKLSLVSRVTFAYFVSEPHIHTHTPCAVLYIPSLNRLNKLDLTLKVLEWPKAVQELQHWV